MKNVLNIQLIIVLGHIDVDIFVEYLRIQVSGLLVDFYVKNFAVYRAPIYF